MYYALFATSDEITALIAVGSGLLGSAIPWLANWFRDRSKQQREDDKEDEETAITRLENLMKRYDAERRDMVVEITSLRTDCTETKVTLARAVTWIKMLEAILARERIDHPRWSDTATGDTGNHVALAQQKQG